MEKIFCAKCGKSALLHNKTTNLQVTLVYQESHEKVFYDSLQFWNSKEEQWEIP
jgi:hypothetical protein